jgi:hypothetical protein
MLATQGQIDRPVSGRLAGAASCGMEVAGGCVSGGCGACVAVGGAASVRVGVGAGKWVADCRGWMRKGPLRLPCASTSPAGPGPKKYDAGCGLVAGESASRMRRCSVRVAPAARSNGAASVV